MAGRLTGDPLLAVNRAFYDTLWGDARLIGPERFNTWPLVTSLCRPGTRCLEVGAGLRPRLPIPGTVFIDISLPALRPLRAVRGRSVAGLITALPLADASFDVVSALDIVEHVADDAAAFAELSRVAAPGAVLLLSVPLHQAAWSAFDAAVGHHRRYDPAALLALLAAHGFAVERSAGAGMRPRSSRLLDLGMWFLRHQHRRAMWWYNRVFMPLGLRRASPLVLHDGVTNPEDLAGLLLVCRRLPFVAQPGAAL